MYYCMYSTVPYFVRKRVLTFCNFGYEALKNEAYKVLLFMTHLIPILKICISKKVSLSTLCFCYAFSWRIHFLNGSEVSLEAGATFEKPHLSRTKATLLDSIFPQSFTLFWLHWVFRLPFFEGWVQFVKREMLSHMWVHFSKTTARIARASAATQKTRVTRRS